MWVWFDVDADSWIVWDETSGYRQVSNRSFEKEYELEAGLSTFELPDVEPEQ